MLAGGGDVQRGLVMQVVRQQIFHKINVRQRQQVVVIGEDPVVGDTPGPPALAGDLLISVADGDDPRPVVGQVLQRVQV